MSPSGAPSDRLTDEEIADVINEFFGEIEEVSAIEQQVRKTLQSIRVRAEQGEELTLSEKCFRGLVAELRATTFEEKIIYVLNAVELLRKDLDDFAEYASLLSRYADYRRKDPEFSHVQDLVDEQAVQYVEFCRNHPDDIAQRRKLFDQLCDKFLKSADDVTWMNEVGPQVVAFLAEEERELKALEKKSRATDRLKRRISGDAITLKKEIDEFDNPLLLDKLIKRNKKFKDFADEDRDYLLTYAFDRLQELLDKKAVELELFFKQQFSFLASLNDKSVLRRELEKCRQSLEEACERNHIFKDQYSDRWWTRMEKFTEYSLQQESSCVRMAFYALLVAGAAVAGAHFDQWKERFGLYLHDRPPASTPEAPGSDEGK